VREVAEAFLEALLMLDLRRFGGDESEAIDMASSICAGISIAGAAVKAKG